MFSSALMIASCVAPEYSICTLKNMQGPLFLCSTSHALRTWRMDGVHDSIITWQIQERCYLDATAMVAAEFGFLGASTMFSMALTIQ
jgi:hypothetical protein